jgi:hypothetical protein
MDIIEVYNQLAEAIAILDDKKADGIIGGYNVYTNIMVAIDSTIDERIRININIPKMMYGKQITIYEQDIKMFTAALKAGAII